MKREAIIAGGTMVLTAFLMWKFMPRKEVVKIVPNIITKFDTVRTTPKWYDDSVKYWKKRKFTTDTVNIYVENIVVRDTGSTRFVNVGPDTTDRPSIWPITSYHGGTRFGDTAIVTSFNLRTGNGSITKIFIPGMLTSIVADSGSPLPRMTFAPFPKEKKPSLWYKIQLVASGFSACTIINSVR